MASRAAPFAFAACCVIWGTTFLTIRYSNSALPPFWGAALRLGIAGLVLAIVWLAMRTPMPRGRILLVVLVFGVLDFGANLGLLYWAERTVPSGLSAVFYATVPITTILVARAFGQERLDAWKLVATLVAFLGVVLVFASELSTRAQAIALLAVLGSATLAAVSSVLLRFIPPQPVVPTVALGCLASAIFLTLVSLVAGESLALPASARDWAPVLYLAVAGSIGAFSLFTWLLNQWRASSVTLIGVVVPIVAVAVGAIVGGERLALTTLVGGALVITGVLAALVRARMLERDGRASAQKHAALDASS